MQGYKWRVSAKAVAIIYLVLPIFAWLVMIVDGVAAGWTMMMAFIGFNDLATYPDTGNLIEILDEAKAELYESGANYFPGSVMIEIWAATKLLSGTESGQEPCDAYRSCAMWRNVCLLFTLLEVISHISSGSYLLLMGDLLIRGGFLFIVYSFLEELERTMAGPDSY